MADSEQGDLEADGSFIFDFTEYPDEDDMSEEELENPPQIVERQIRVANGKQAIKDLNRIDKKIRRDTDNEQDGFMMFNTASSYAIQDCFAKEIKSISAKLRKGNVHEALILALAVLVMMENYDYFYGDTDVPEVVEKIMKAYYKVWEKLFEKTDEELGLTNRSMLKEILIEFGEGVAQIAYEFPWFE